MRLATKVLVDEIPKTPTLRAGVVAVIGHLRPGVAGRQLHRGEQGRDRSGDRQLGEGRSVDIRVRTVLRLGAALQPRRDSPTGTWGSGTAAGCQGLCPAASAPAWNGCFFIPTYGSLTAAINFDQSGTTKIGKYVLNHSFMIPGLVATAVAVTVGLFLAQLTF